MNCDFTKAPATQCKNNFASAFVYLNALEIKFNNKITKILYCEFAQHMHLLSSSSSSTSSTTSFQWIKSIKTLWLFWLVARSKWIFSNFMEIIREVRKSICWCWFTANLCKSVPMQMFQVTTWKFNRNSIFTTNPQHISHSLIWVVLPSKERNGLAFD